MKELNEVKYPSGFINPKTAVLGDEGINKLIKMLKMEQGHFISTADTLVIMSGLGFVEVYRLVASCEVEVDW